LKHNSLNEIIKSEFTIHNSFRSRIATFFKLWTTATSEVLEKYQQEYLVDKSINPDDCAPFILCALEGIFGMVKNHQNKAVYYNSCGREL